MYTLYYGALVEVIYTASWDSLLYLCSCYTEGDHCDWYPAAILDLSHLHCLLLFLVAEEADKYYCGNKNDCGHG